MLFYFHVSIKPEDLEKAKIKEQLVAWGGELFSQEPPRYEYGNSLIFDEFPDNRYFKKYYRKFMGDDFDIDQYRTFWLSGDDIHDLELLVNRKPAEVKNNELYKFLVDLSELEEFAIFLIRDEEEIDGRYEISTKEELTTIFCNCLNWNSLEGALIIKSRYDVEGMARRGKNQKNGFVQTIAVEAGKIHRVAENKEKLLATVPVTF